MADRKRDQEQEGQASHGEDTASLPDKKNALEWIVFSLGLVLVLGIIAYLCYQTAIYRSGTPDLYVHYVKDPSTHNPNRYRIIVTNKGGKTAEEVKIEATLRKGDSNLEKAELEIAFSPKLSEREGWVNFSAASSTADSIYVRVVSYQSP
jgi:uncharacterized protein (TIGR02588 family)